MPKRQISLIRILKKKRPGHGEGLHHEVTDVEEPQFFCYKAIPFILKYVLLCYNSEQFSLVFVFLFVIRAMLL